MNLRGKMKKLQTATVKYGLVIKINSNEFYSAEQKRMITSYSIAIPTVKKIETIDDVSYGRAYIEERKDTISITYLDDNEIRRTIKVKNTTKDILVDDITISVNGRDFVILKSCSMPAIIFCLRDIYKAVSQWKE